MKIKRFISLGICLSLLMCTACQKTDSSTSSSTQSTATSSTTSSITSDTTSSVTTSSDAIDFERMYGLKSLESVVYTCYKDIPNGEAQYEITEVLNDKGQDLKTSCDYTCESKDIKIEGLIVTVPAEYKATKKPVKIKATHRLSGITLDFELKYASNYKLIFEDEFEGDTLNTDVWGDIWDTGIDHEGREEYSYGYLKENVFVDGKGHLINRVEALHEKNKYGQPTYSASLISTKNCFESRYGYYEMSVIPHLTTGMWGAFWILAGDMDDHNAPDDNSTKNGVEIDIFETLLAKNAARHALFWDGYTDGLDGYGVMSPEMPEIFDGKFHKFAVQWTPTDFIFLIDDQVTYRWTGTDGCDQPGYMLISSHVNSEGTGELLLKPGEYSDMIVDYVRIYSSED